MSLHIAMIGQKGLPATFGGIEHHVEEIGRRLVQRGHRVTVYSRSTYGTKRVSEHLGMEIVDVPTVASKHLDAIVHSALSTVVAMRARPDIVHYHALGPGLVAPLPRYLSRAKVVQTIHGRDDRRAKWSRPAQAVLTSAAWLSGHVPDVTITVSEELRDDYRRQYRCPAQYVPNGVDRPERRPADLIRDQFGLGEGDYLLFVGRLVPEKAPDLLMRAYRRVPGDRRLVFAGGSSFTPEYVEQLQRLAADDRRVLLADYVYGDALAELYSNAAAFVLPSDLEGLPLTLLEAASYGVPVIASDIGPHVEVLERDDAGRRLFRRGDEDALVRILTRVLDEHDREAEGARSLRDDVCRRYDWDRVAAATEAAYLRARSGGALGDDVYTELTEPNPQGGTT